MSVSNRLQLPVCIILTNSQRGGAEMSFIQETKQDRTLHRLASFNIPLSCPTDKNSCQGKTWALTQTVGLMDQELCWP